MTELMHDNLSSRFLNWKLFIQNCSNLNDTVTRSESFTVEDSLFYLAPLSPIDLANKERIRLLTEWRDKNQFAYPSRFECSETLTKKWLEERILQNNHIVMFWITDNYFSLLGHISIRLNEDNVFEIENVLKGNITIKGLMSEALKKLEIIVDQEFNPKEVFLKVLESNMNAINFYKKLKYSVVKFEEMKWKHSPEGKVLIPGSPAEEKLLTMKKNLIDLTDVPQKLLTAGLQFQVEKLYMLIKLFHSGGILTIQVILSYLKKSLPKVLAPSMQWQQVAVLELFIFLCWH